MYDKDPKEENPDYKHIFEAVDKYLDEKFKYVKKDLGFCHYYWGEKKDRLWKKYGMDWKTPAEMNPDILFD